jgi:hypothetical protein
VQLENPRRLRGDLDAAAAAAVLGESAASAQAGERRLAGKVAALRQ